MSERRVTALVAKGVELLDIAEVKSRLGGHEGAQRQFERPVLVRVERTEGKAGQLSVGADDQGDGVSLANGDHHRRQPDDDGGRRHQWVAASSNGMPTPLYS